MSAKHTSGPWQAKPSNNEITNADHGRLPFAIVAGYTLIAASYDEKDANLIAAAPCLVEALQELTQIASVLEATCLGDSRAKENRMDRARAAIAKATGEQA
jgi:hypothetical protein